MQVPFGIVDGNSVDAVLHVGVTSGEHTDYAGLLDMHDASKYSFSGSGSSAAFTVATTAVARTQSLSDDLGGPTLSGVAVEPTNHYALFIDEFGSSLAVGLLDDPARPVNGSAWQGFVDWRYYNAESSEYEGAGYDPHAVGALQAAANNKSYGFALSDASGTRLRRWPRRVATRARSMSWPVIPSSPRERGRRRSSRSWRSMPILHPGNVIGLRQGQCEEQAAGRTPLRHAGSASLIHYRWRVAGPGAVSSRPFRLADISIPKLRVGLVTDAGLAGHW